jgi:TRAP-type C4-dicarboxylate transport system permease small subunit
MQKLDTERTLQRRSALWYVLLRLPELFTAALIAFLVVFLSLAVVSRYLFDIGLVWSDEAARLMFVWIVFIGFAIGVRHRAHIGVEWFVDLLPTGMRRVVALLQDAALFVFSLFFFWESIVTARFSFMQILPGLEISIAWLYMAVVAAAVLMIIYTAANLWDTIRGRARRTDVVGEDAIRQAE